MTDKEIEEASNVELLDRLVSIAEATWFPDGQYAVTRSAEIRRLGCAILDRMVGGGMPNP
jgi:hypothetical protein